MTDLPSEAVFAVARVFADNFYRPRQFDPRDLHPAKGPTVLAEEALRAALDTGTVVDASVGSPGVMHAIDRAFYDLSIKERDFERHRVDRLERDLGRLREVARTLLDAKDRAILCYVDDRWAALRREVER